MGRRRDRVELGPIEPHRVCLIKPSALGDVVHTLPTLAALRDRWPRAHVSWVVNRGLMGLLEGHPDLDEVIPFDRPRFGPAGRGLIDFSRFLQDLRRREFDLAIDLQGLLRSGLMTWATGAPVRVGRDDAREGATAFYTHRIRSEQPHAVDRLLDVALACGADISNVRFHPVLRESDRSWARYSLEGVPSPRLFVNLGARWETKRWPPHAFAEVARRAALEFGAGIVAVGAPEDMPSVSEFCTRLEADGIAVRNLCGQSSLTGLAALAELADLFLSNDTGPLHLAAATGVPTVAVFLCTDPAKTRAYSSNAEFVATRVWCAASCIKKCERLECMSELTPDRVWNTVRHRLLHAHSAHSVSIGPSNPGSTVRPSTPE